MSCTGLSSNADRPVVELTVSARVDPSETEAVKQQVLERTALRGGNPCRAKAYSRAADSLSTLAIPLDRLIEENRLTDIPGVGDAIADIIAKLHREGTHPSLEQLRKEIPASVLELLSVPGLRPDKVLRLYKDLGIASFAELEAAAKEDRIKTVKDLGAALQAKILQNLTIARSGEGCLHLHRAAALLEHAKESIGIGGSLAAPPLPHHPAYGSVHGGSRSCANTIGTRMAGRAI